MSFERDGVRPVPLEAPNLYPFLFGSPPNPSQEDSPPIGHRSSGRRGNRRVTINSVMDDDDIDHHFRGFNLFRSPANAEENPNRNLNVVNSERSPPCHSRGTPSDRQQAKAFFASSHHNETRNDGTTVASSGQSSEPTNAGSILGNSNEANGNASIIATAGTSAGGTPPGLREYKQKRHAEFLESKAIMLGEENGDLRRLLMDESDRNSWLAQELRKEKQYSSGLEYRMELLQNKSNESDFEALPDVDPPSVHHRHEMSVLYPMAQQDQGPVPNNVVVATENNSTQVSIVDLAAKVQTLEDELAASKNKKRKRSRTSKKERQSKTHKTEQESSKQSSCIIM